MILIWFVILLLFAVLVLLSLRMKNNTMTVAFMAMVITVALFLVTMWIVNVQNESSKEHQQRVESLLTEIRDKLPMDTKK